MRIVGSIFIVLACLVCTNVSAQAISTTQKNANSPDQDSFFQSIYVSPAAASSYQNKLSGDWNGYRKKLAEQGVTIDLSYTNNLLGNPIGGLRQGFAYTDSTGLNINFDLQKLASLTNLYFHIALVQRNGSSLSQESIGNLFPVSQIYGGENFRMNTIYLKKTLFNNKLQLSVGRLNAGDYFLQSPLYYSYVSNTYDGNPIGVFFNVPFSAYPNAQWGAYLYSRLSKTIAGKIAVFNTNTSVSDNKFHGFNFSFHSNNGVMLITELDLLNNKNLCFISCKLPGRYTAGFMYFTGRDQQNFITNQPVKGNYGFYYQLEQKWYQPGLNALRGLSTFFVMELFPKQYNRIPLFFDTGIVYRGLIARRPQDFITLAYAYGKFSQTLITSQRIANLPIQNFEANVELSYRFYARPWFFIQPDISIG